MKRPFFAIIFYILIPFTIFPPSFSLWLECCRILISLTQLPERKMKYLLIVGILIGSCSLGLAQGNIDNSEVTAALDVAANEPLYIVSSMKTAKIVTKDQFEKISREDIDYIKVINDPQSLNIYGDKARHGVVLVVLKGNSVSEKYSVKKRKQR